MSDEIKIKPDPELPPNNPDSSLFGVSLRAWLSASVIVTVCVMSIMNKEVVEPLYGLAQMAIGFYFGQKLK